MDSVGRWASIGPTSIDGGGSRATGALLVIAIDRRDPETIYVGGNGSGVWRTTSGGREWLPITHPLPSLGVAALGIDPVDTARIYLVTPDVGVFCSDDRGPMWTIVTA